MNKIFFGALVLTLFISSCNVIDRQRIKGNGTVTSKTYDLKDFKSIDVGGASTIFLKQDSVFNVKIETDENLFEYITTSINDGELDIDEKDGYNLRPSKEIKIYISMPLLQNASISGASTVQTDNKFEQNESFGLDISGASNGTIQVKAPAVNIELSGASTLNITGESKDIKAEISGASTLRAFDLKAENTDVDASGASTANVFASILLNADASGASSINYQGNSKVTSTANGASSVKKAD